MAVVLPDWLDTALDIVGIAWPNVDEDAYRDMAVSLREFAEDVDDDGHAANLHVQRLLSSGSGEALTALSTHWDKVKGKQGDIAGAARIIADALDAAAGVIEAMKYACIGHLSAMIAQAGISLAAAPFTFGLSTLISAGTITATRTLVKQLIKEAGEEAVGYIMAALTEPAVSAIENVAADLAVQIGANALGLQNGIDTGQAVRAGQDGFQEGVTTGQDSLRLASASGGPGPGSLGGLIGDLGIDHAEHDRATGRLFTVGDSVSGRTSTRLNTARGHHSRTRGRDSIAEIIDPIADRAIATLGKASKDYGDHLGGSLSQGIRRNSTDQHNRDVDIRDRIHRIGGGDGDDGRGGDTRTRPASAGDVPGQARERSVALADRNCKTDPVDMASGEMVLPQTDLALPGVLPLVLRRTHISGYRYGHCFGASWASTLDERLEMVGSGAVYCREDGSVLFYPHLPTDTETGGDTAADTSGVLPLEGDRLPLTLSARTALGDTTYSVTDPHSGLVRHFTGSPYRSGGLYWLEEIEDRNGNAVRIGRGDHGLPDTVVHDGGYRVRVAHDTALVRVTGLAVETPEGPVSVASFGYDSMGSLTEVSGARDVPLRFTYDDEHRVTSWTDRNGHTYRYVYDAAGRVVETVGPDGALSSRFSYDPEARVTRFTDSTGARTVTRFNPLGQTIAETDARGHTVLFTWDRHDRLLSRTDELGNTAAFRYDERGDLVTMVLPDGRTASADYDERHLPLRVTGPDGSEWRQSFDERGNRLSVTAPDGTSTTFTHDATGAPATVTFPNGVTERRVSDPAGLTLSATDPAGATYTLRRDAFGRPVESVDPAGSVTRLEWTTDGLLSRRTAPDGAVESWTWDEEGNCLSYTDVLGATARFEYTWFDLLRARTGVDGARHEFTYDTELRVTGVRNPQGREWTYTYGATGLTVSETDFDGRTTRYEHDAAGRRTAKAGPHGHRVTFAYDALGNLVEKDSAGLVTRFTYDDGDRLTRAESPQSVLTLERDATGRLLTETVDGHTMRYGYDAGGELVSRTTPTGVVTRYAYDGAGHRTRVETDGHALDQTHDALGRELTRSFGDPARPVTLASTWDAAGRLTAQTVSTAHRTLRSRAFGYRADGLLTSATDHRTGLTARFDLDPLGRPLGITLGDWSERYGYDSTGNQTSAHWPDAAGHPESRGERTYDGTRLVSAGGLRYAYDEAGRVVLRQQKRLSRKPDTWRYTWDAEDRLTSCTTPDGTLWRYTYDAIGRRTAKHRMAPDGTTVLSTVRFSWDDTRLAEQSDSATGTTLTWDHEGYRPIAQTERRTTGDTDSRFFAIVTDLVGTPTELVDESGDIAWYNRSTIWGLTAWNRDATAYTPLRFPGQYADPETGLHYNVHRHYDPATGRYLSSDPLGLAPAPNPATYVTNPATWMDPEGLIAKGCTERGGWYGGMLPANVRADGTAFPQPMEVNHIPPKAAWKNVVEPGFYIANRPHKKQKVNNGPAIRMERADHKQLNSTGNDLVAQAWHQWQRELIAQGKLTEAMRMDIDDIKHKFPGQYDDHIRDMVHSLKDNKNFQDMLTTRGWTVDETELLR
ncbi:DUF6531 domain-containing protein [Streptomyces sp. NPDC048290]|uniref:DUF6531 domain-containing protein n=1 Tax=Streptomyces sp. NPDC048290 TaxID=3155811 RepID=UPI00341C7B80